MESSLSHIYCIEALTSLSLLHLRKTKAKIISFDIFLNGLGVAP